MQQIKIIAALHSTISLAKIGIIEKRPPSIHLYIIGKDSAKTFNLINKIADEI
jgi:hypothetical protein